MQRAIVFDRVVHRRFQREIVKELAGLDLSIDSFKVATQHAARADGQMAHIRIAHHTFRQTDALAGCFNECVRIFIAQLVVKRHLGLGNRVAFTLSAMAEAVENDQCEWSFGFAQKIVRQTSVCRLQIWNQTLSTN